MFPVYLGGQDIWLGILRVNPIAHFAVDFNSDRLIAVRADRINGDGRRLFPQSPLHEGRGNCIDRSGGIYAFTGAERCPVRCFVCRDRKGPEDSPLLIPNQKKKMFLKIIEYFGCF